LSRALCDRITNVETFSTGKTVFLFYLLLLRILEGKPTLLRLDKGRLVGFSSDGMRVHSSKEPDRDDLWDYPRGTWALADPNYGEERVFGAPGGPLLHDPHLFVVFTTSPERKRFAEWAKQTISPVLVMHPIPYDELVAFW
jgi:hypothetical protein